MSGKITHSWNGTILTITSDSGTSSSDLKGEKGDMGIRGAQGVAGTLLTEHLEQLEDATAAANEATATAASATTTANNAMAKADAATAAVEEACEEVQASIDRVNNAVATVDGKAEKGVAGETTLLANTRNIPTDALPYALIHSIGGMSYNCTNLLRYPYAETTGNRNGMTFTDNGNGTISVSGATTSEKAVFWLTNDLQLPTGKYCFTLREEYADDGILLSVMKNGKWIFDTATKNVLDVASGDIIRVYLQVASNKTISGSIVAPRINAGETALPFESYYSGIHSTPVTAIECTGANLFNPNVLIEGSATEDNGIYTFYNSTLYNYWAGKYPLSEENFKPNTQYVIGFDGYNENEPSQANSLMFVFEYTDGTRSDLFIDSQEWAHREMITDEGKTVARMRFSYQNGGWCHLKNLFISEYTGANAYTPYTKHIIEIPQEVQELDGYGIGIDEESYNSIEWREDGVYFIKKCARIILNNDNVVYRDNYAPNYRFGFNIADKKPSEGNTAKMVSNIAITTEPIYSPAATIQYCIAASNSSGFVYVSIPNCATAADANTYLNSNPIELIYELATPEEIDITDIFNCSEILKIEGGGSLTFANMHNAGVLSKVDIYGGNNIAIGADTIIGNLIGEASSAKCDASGSNIAIRFQWLENTAAELEAKASGLQDITNDLNADIATAIDDINAISQTLTNQGNSITAINNKLAEQEEAAQYLADIVYNNVGSAVSQLQDGQEELSQQLTQIEANTWKDVSWTFVNDATILGSGTYIFALQAEVDSARTMLNFGVIEYFDADGCTYYSAFASDSATYFYQVRIAAGVPSLYRCKISGGTFEAIALSSERQLKYKKVI